MFGWTLPPGCGLNEIDELSEEEGLPEEIADMPYYLESEYLLLEEEAEGLAWDSTDPMDRLTAKSRQALDEAAWDELEADGYERYRRVYQSNL